MGDAARNLDYLRRPVKESERIPGPYPYYGASGVVDHVNGYTCDGEYLLVAEDGENLRTVKTPIAFLARGKFWVNNHAHILEGIPGVSDTRYLMHAIRYVGVDGFLTGSTMPKLTQGNLNRIQVPLPPLDEQRAIAEVLGALDDKVELNRQMNHTLEEMASALFKSWFVDFDPVVAKADGRRPFGMDAATAALFPARMGASAPEGWPAVSLSSLLHGTKGRSYTSANLNDSSETALVSLKSFNRGGGYRRDGLKGYRGPYKPEQVIHPGDVIVALTDVTQQADVIGRAAIVEEDANYKTLVASLDVLIARPASGVPRQFLYWLLRSSEYVDHILGYANGTTVLHLDALGLDHFVTTRAAPPVLAAFQERAGAWYDLQAANTRESRTLTALRDTLLPKLLSGEVRLKQAEKLVEAAL